MPEAPEKENAKPLDELDSSGKGDNGKRKFFATPVAKLNRSIVKGGGNRRAVNGNVSHTSILYKQSLKSNNKNLARALDLCKQDTAALAKKVLDLEQEKQAQAAKISVLRRLTDQSSEAIEAEIQNRMKLRIEQLRRKLENSANLLHMAGDELHDVIVMCDHQRVKDIDEIVKDTLELTQMCTPTSDQFNRLQKTRKPKSVYSTINEPVNSTAIPHLLDVIPPVDDSENRLSIVNESTEMKRKSSLGQSLHTKDDHSSVPMDIENPSLPTRSKRRTLRSSQRASPEVTVFSPEVQAPEHLVRRSKRRTRKSSFNKADRDMVTDDIKPLETVFSAANVQPCGAPVQGSPQLPPASTDTVGVDDLPPSEPCQDKDLEKIVFNVGTSQQDHQIPYDEIPVGVGRVAREKALDELMATTGVSRSRRETIVLQHNQEAVNGDQTAVLNAAVDKFYIKFSPPRIFNGTKDKKDSSAVTSARSHRGTFTIEDHTQNLIQNECDSLLVQSDTEGETTLVAGLHEEAPSSMEEVDDLSTEPCATPEKSDLPIDVAAAVDAKPAAAVKEPLARQMEILCKGGQVKVSVGNRDGGPASTRNKRKPDKKLLEKTAANRQKDQKDPFELTFSETITDAAKTLHDFNDQLTAKVAASTSVADEKEDNVHHKPSTSALSDEESSHVIAVLAKTKGTKQKKKAAPKKEIAKSRKEVEKVSKGVKKQSGRPKRSTINAPRYAELDDSTVDGLVSSNEQVQNTQIKIDESELPVLSDENIESVINSKTEAKSRRRHKEETNSLRVGNDTDGSQRVQSTGRQGEAITNGDGPVTSGRLAHLLLSDEDSPVKEQRDAKRTRTKKAPAKSRVARTKNVHKVLSDSSDDEHVSVEKLRKKRRVKKESGGKVSELEVMSDDSVYSHTSTRGNRHIDVDEGYDLDKLNNLSDGSMCSQSKRQPAPTSSHKGTENVDSVVSKRKGRGKNSKIAKQLSVDIDTEEIEVKVGEDEVRPTRKRKAKATGLDTDTVPVSNTKPSTKKTGRVKKSATKSKQGVVETDAVDKPSGKANIESRFAEGDESISKVVVMRKSSKLADIDQLMLSDSDDDIPPRVKAKQRRAHVFTSPVVLTPSPAADRTLTLSADKPLLSTDDDIAPTKNVSDEKLPAKLEIPSPKRSRRAAANINFKEPSLGGKLRRGDPGTSTLYNCDLTATKTGKKAKKSVAASK